MRRLFDVDPAKRTRTYFHYEDNGSVSKDRIIFESVADVQPILDYNTFAQKYNTGRWGDLAHVGRIPSDIWLELERTGIAFDDKALDRWLDDPDNRKLRVKLGRLS